MTEFRRQVRSPFSGAVGVVVVIARLVAFGGVPRPVAAARCTAPSCNDCGLEADAIATIEKKIATTPVYMTAIDNMRCTLAGRHKFQQCGIELKEDTFAPADISTTWHDFSQTSDGTWKYMNCKYHVEEGGMVMHSYVFVDGKLMGDGFDVSKMSCSNLRSSTSSSSTSGTTGEREG